MNKKDIDALNKELVITDILVRLTVIEKLLFSKKIITKEEHSEIVQELSEKLARSILEGANVSGDIDKMMAQFKKHNKPSAGN